jgi:hypothetical protein
MASVSRAQCRRCGVFVIFCERRLSEGTLTWGHTECIAGMTIGALSTAG